jgi:predicted N-formylglutamate amidohydrolase
MRDFMLVTCEHGGNQIPADYAELFRGWEPVLDTHRGFDRGALAMASDLADAFQAPLVASTVSRLLIDLNRSLTNPNVWSSATRSLPEADKQRIVQHHYVPYRQRVEEAVHEAVTAGCRVIHLSSHSFTPVRDGQVRTADAGLLYDPARGGEVDLAASWKAALVTRQPAMRVRRNYPYAGKNDGLTSSLRRRYPPESYVGIEIELNKALVLDGQQRWQDVRGLMIASLQAALR